MKKPVWMEKKRYFAYGTDSVGMMVRDHDYFDDLEEAMRFAQSVAMKWGGSWAVTDTTQLGAEGKPGKLIEYGECARARKACSE